MGEKKPDINRTRRMLNNTLRYCHNLYNKVGFKEQTWLSEINQAAKEALELLKEQEQVGIGRALVIFSDINNEGFSTDEKIAAIRRVLKMPTHNSIKKDWMLEVIQWMLEGPKDE